MNKKELLEKYYIILIDTTLDREVLVCKEKSSHSYYFFEENNGIITPTDSESEKELKKIYNNKATGILNLKLSTSLQRNSNIRNILNNLINHKLTNHFQSLENKNIQKINENLENLKVMSLEEFGSLKGYDSEIVKQLKIAGSYSLLSHSIGIGKDYIDNENLLHELFHSISASKDRKRSGFYTEESENSKYTAINEYYTEYLVKKIFTKHKIFYFTHSLSFSLFDKKEDLYIQSYYENSYESLIKNLAKYYHTDKYKIDELFATFDTLLSLFNYILDNEEYFERNRKKFKSHRLTLLSTYKRAMSDIIDLKTNKLRLENKEISKKTLKIDLSEANEIDEELYFYLKYKIENIENENRKLQTNDAQVLGE